MQSAIINEMLSNYSDINKTYIKHMMVDETLQTW